MEISVSGLVFLGNYYHLYVGWSGEGNEIEII
jgi:hypothetical protein